MKNFFKKILDFMKKYWYIFIIIVLTSIIVIFIFKSCDYEQNDLAKKILIESLQNENSKLKVENENILIPLSTF